MALQTTYQQDLNIGFAGQLQHANPGDIIPKVNSEASYAIPFGVAVCYGATDDAALSPDATSDVIVGINLHRHGSIGSSTTELDANGAVNPNTVMNVLRKGKVFVVCENGCVPGNRLFIRCVVAGAEVEGALRSAADSTDCIDSSNQGTWLTTASAGGLALLEVDFTASPNIGS